MSEFQGDVRGLKVKVIQVEAVNQIEAWLRYHPITQLRSLTILLAAFTCNVAKAEW